MSVGSCNEKTSQLYNGVEKYNKPSKVENQGLDLIAHVKKTLTVAK